MTLKNFKSYGPKPQTVDLRNVDAVGIGGRNGAGKTSLVEALTFALYGKAAATEVRELGEASMINDRADEAYVSVTFEKDNNLYTVERTIRRKGAGKARLTSPVLPQPIADVKAVNTKINSLLGMDYETFISSTIIRQDEMDRLTARRPSERKEILMNIFGLHTYEAMKDKAREKTWEINSRIAGLEATKKNLENKINQEETIKQKLANHEVKIKILEDDISKMEADKRLVEYRLEELQKMKAEYDSKTLEVKRINEQLSRDEANMENIRREIMEATMAIEELENIKPLLEERTRLNLELENLMQKREELKVKSAKIQETMKEIEKRIMEESENYMRIKGHEIPECPICKRPLDETHRNQLLQDYELKINILKNEHEKLTGEIHIIENILNQDLHPKIQKKQVTLKELEGIGEKIGRLSAIINRLPNLKDEELKLTESINKGKRRISELEEKLQALSPIIQSYINLEDERRRLENILRRVEGELGVERANRDRAKIDLAEIEEAKTQHKKIVEQLDQDGRLKAAYESLERRVFHKDGIPTAILREIIPEIEQEASKILRDLSNGRMDIRFRLGRETKKGKVTEELIVEAVDQTGSHPVTRYSGGERMRINLALRLGVSEVITKRSGYRGRIETLVIDEGFGPLDEDGRRATIEILQALRQRFRKILVISHIDDVREAFESRIIVDKPIGGYSSISII
ncbi:MAG: AAA family ATPase [Candidatus Bathyarchaeia archaeon]